MSDTIPPEYIRRICNTCNREMIGKGKCDCGNPEYRLYVSLELAETLLAENQRLREALREAIECLDVDNLTQQSRYREWKKMVRGEE